ncbi:MAG: hypothetical protein H5T84_09605, partial [Thermoleophilia bacterium]|nr:hypothetical protein [Thermoleophilia bacterium]
MCSACCAVGVAVTGLGSIAWPVAIAGLLAALIVAVGALARAAPRKLSGGAAPPTLILLVAVVLVAFFSGLTVGSVRLLSLGGGPLSSEYGRRVQVEAVITGPVRERDGWQEAAALVEGQKVWRGPGYGCSGLWSFSHPHLSATADGKG